MGKDKFSRKGTVALRTLKRPTVHDFVDAHQQKVAGIEKEKVDLAQEGGLDGLFHLLNNDHARVQAVTPQVINSLVRTEDGEVTLLNEQAWAGLLELSVVKETGIRTDAIWTVAILAANPECHEQITNTFGWKTILSFLRTDDTDIQVAANILLANLSIKEENQEQMIENGGLKVLLEQATNTSNMQIKRSAATAIANTVIESENAREFTSVGGVELLQQFLESGDEELVQVAVSTIANITNSDDPEIKAKVVSVIGINKLVELLKSGDASVQKSAAIAIVHYADQEEHQQALFDLHVVDSLLSLLGSTDTATLAAIATTISSLSQNGKISKALYDDGVGEKLKVLLSTDDTDIKTETNSALANINLHAPPPAEEPAPAQEATPELSSVPSLESLAKQAEGISLAPEPTTIVEEASAPAPSPDEAPAPAPSATKKEEAVNVSGVPGLLEKIASKDLAQQKEGAAGLAGLLDNAAAREQVVGAIGPKGLNILHTALVEAKDQALLIDVTKVFVAVAATPIREKIRFAEIAQALFNMLSLSPEAQSEALQLLTPISFKNPNNQAIMMKLSFIDNFINLLRPTSSEEIRGKASKALHAIAYQNRQAQQLFNKRRAFPLLVALLETNTVQVQKAACGAVYALADQNLANQNEFRKVNVLIPVTKLLGSTEEAVRQAAAGTFYALLHDNRKVQELAQHSIQPLINLLTSKSVPVLSNSTAAITELVRGSEKNQELVCTSEAAKLLVGLLSTSKDFWVVFNTLSIISTLIKKKVPVKRREMFHHTGLETALASHLNNEHPSVKKEATKVLGYVRDYK